MRCQRCNREMDANEARDYYGQSLCEDCYLDALSPVRACDPWAVHSAKNFEKHSAKNSGLTGLQSKILAILEQTGGIEPEALLQRLGQDLSTADLQRELAALRHMEKARAQKKGPGIVWRPW